MSTPKDKNAPKRESPLAGSALFVGPSAPPLPPVPTNQAVVPPPQEEVQATPEEPPFLYQSEPSPEYMDRPFDRQRIKGAINSNPYLQGAIDAIAKIRRVDKYEIYDEMCLDYIEKYHQLLEQRPDVVRYYEQKYKDKYHL